MWGSGEDDPILFPYACFPSLCLAALSGHTEELAMRPGSLRTSGTFRGESGCLRGYSAGVVLGRTRTPFSAGEEAAGRARGLPSSWKEIIDKWLISNSLKMICLLNALGKQQGRDLYGFWHCWWLYKLIQVISGANLFVEKQEPTHRRAAFEFWTLNKVLISSRSCIFSFPSPPLNTFLYLFIFSFHLLLSPFTFLDL